MSLASDLKRLLLIQGEPTPQPSPIVDEVAEAIERAHKYLALTDDQWETMFLARSLRRGFAADIRKMAAALVSPPKAGAAMIDQMPDDELFKDRSNENPNVGKLRSPPKAGEGEAVGFRWRMSPSDHWSQPHAIELLPSTLNDGREIQYLYATQQPRVDGVRVTDDTVERAETAMRSFLRNRSMYDAGVMQFVGKELARTALEAALVFHAPAIGETQPGLSATDETRAAVIAEVSDETAILRRLADGQELCFSTDGDNCWFNGGDRAWVADAAVISLRNKGLLRRYYAPGDEWGADTISEAGLAHLRALANPGDGE